MMSKKAMKLALEALEYIHEGANNQGPHAGISWRCVSNKAEPVITALREALAEQPAQQCWKCGDMDTAFQAQCNVPACGMKEQPEQRTWVGLNDTDLAVCGDEDDVLLARYWERVCREKNT